MVRSVAERAFVPARHLLEEFGDMMILTGKTIWSALRPPYPYGGEFVSLRDSDGTEIQTRQTPISTTFTPGTERSALAPTACAWFQP